MKCNVCGAELSVNARFCKNCGNEVAGEPINTVENRDEYVDYRRGERKRSNTGLIIALVGVSTLLVVTIFVGVIVFISADSKVSETEMEIMADQIEMELIEQRNEKEHTEQADQEPEFPRYVTYSEAYYYKNMPNIHNSVSASNHDANEMYSFINEYNNCWRAYVNYSDPEIYKYLREGTLAYENTVNFNKEGLVEEFDLIDVEDVRRDGNTYYVWVHEKIRKITSHSETVKTYHWVYKVRKDGSGFYVELYTRDPYYN